MCLNKNLTRTVPIVAAFALGVSIALVSCSDRKPAPAPAPATSTPAPPANTASPTISNPAVAPGAGTDVTKKGTETGMVGGEAGTVASSGKPGSGTESGAGTGAAQSSDTKTSNKK